MLMFFGQFVFNVKVFWSNLKKYSQKSINYNYLQFDNVFWSNFLRK